MSGLGGLATWNDERVESEWLTRMVERLRHRGPDDAGTWNESGVGLAHVALQTTIESKHETLPMLDPTGRWAVVSDARLDNRSELIRTFGWSENEPQKITDSALILESFRCWGRSCVSHLVGVFSFVIWDRQERSLFCARDRMGVKPLFFFHEPGRWFVFGSEIKALFCCPWVRRRPNDRAIALYLTMQFFLESSETLFDGVRRLPPAHWMWISADACVCQRYWEPDLRERGGELSDEEFQERFQELFQEAVRCRLRSSVPLGATLSGGLDSSSIVALAHREISAQAREPMHTFSAVFPNASLLDPRIDERFYLREALAVGNFQHHNILTEHTDPMLPEENLLAMMDEATPAPNLFLNWTIYQHAKKVGVPVLFTGWDGDSVISYGLERFKELAQRGQWLTLFQELDHFVSRNRGDALLAGAGRLRRVRAQISLKRLSHRWFWNFVKKWGIGSHWERYLGRFGNPWDVGGEEDLSGVVKAEFLAKTGALEYIKHLQQKNQLGRLTNTPQEEHWWSLNHGLLYFALGLLDKISGAFGIELRHPFLDHRLIEFCVRAPAHRKLKYGWKRYLLRKNMEGILPDSIRWRLKKASLESHFQVNFWKYNRERLRHCLFERSDGLNKYIESEVVRKKFCDIDSLFAYSKTGRELQDVSQLYVFLTLDAWLHYEGFA